MRDWADPARLSGAKRGGVEDDSCTAWMVHWDGVRVEGVALTMYTMYSYCIYTPL